MLKISQVSNCKSIKIDSAALPNIRISRKRGIETQTFSEGEKKFFVIPEKAAKHKRNNKGAGVSNVGGARVFYLPELVAGVSTVSGPPRGCISVSGHRTPGVAPLGSTSSLHEPATRILHYRSLPIPKRKARE